jgi:hypothetical protein
MLATRPRRMWRRTSIRPLRSFWIAITTSNTVSKFTGGFCALCGGLLYPIQVDSATGVVIPLMSDEIPVVREKAASLAAKKQGSCR